MLAKNSQNKRTILKKQKLIGNDIRTNVRVASRRDSPPSWTDEKSRF